MPSEDLKAVKERLRENVAKEFPGLSHMRTSAASDDIRSLLAHVDQIAQKLRERSADWAAQFDQRAVAEARVSALKEALRRCRSQFGFYAEQHMAKSPPDVAKAKTNASFVDLCATALSSLAPVKEEVKPVEGRTYTQAEVDSILRAAFAGDRGKQAEMRLNPSSPEARREEIALPTMESLAFELLRDREGPTEAERLFRDFPARVQMEVQRTADAVRRAQNRDDDADLKNEEGRA